MTPARDVQALAEQMKVLGAYVTDKKNHGSSVYDQAAAMLLALVKERDDWREKAKRLATAVRMNPHLECAIEQRSMMDRAMAAIEGDKSDDHEDHSNER